MKNFLANAADLARAAVHEIAAHLPGAAVHDDAPTTAPALCVVPGRPHPATDGQLCRHHLEELGGWLRDIETEADRLDAAPSLAAPLGAGGAGSLASQRTPVVLDAVVYTDRRSTAHGHRHPGPVCQRCPRLFAAGCACPTAPHRIHLPGCPMLTAHRTCIDILADRDEWESGAARPASVYAVLHGWAQQTRDERLLGIPTRRHVDRVPGHHGPICDDCQHPSCIDMRWVRPIPLQLTIATERDVLTRHLDWIAGRDWVGDMRAELADLRASLMAANHNQDDKPLTGYCYRLVDDHGTECRGNLWPVYPDHSSGDGIDDGPLVAREVYCDRNPTHRWKGGRGGDLARLSLILEQQRRRGDIGDGPTAPPARPTDVYPVSEGTMAPDRLRWLLDQQKRQDEAENQRTTSW